MTHLGELVAAYAITFGAIGAYAAWLLAKRRAMQRAAGPAADPDGRAGVTADR